MSEQPPADRRAETELPAHPEADDTSAGKDGTPVNWAMVLVFGLVGAVVVVILILHLTGVVGPAGHR
jgi:hypothetical protein